MKRSKPLRRSKGLRPQDPRGSASQRRRAARTRLSEDVKRQAYTRWQHQCACGCGQFCPPSNPASYHHILPKQLWPELEDCTWNIALVFIDCHARHETGFQRLPRKVAKWLEQLVDLDERQVAYLDRVYGPVASAPPDSMPPDQAIKKGDGSWRAIGAAAGATTMDAAPAADAAWPGHASGGASRSRTGRGDSSG